MNKKLFFFALICILTSTLLVSCRNLTQSPVQEFSFSIDAATAAKIAEKAPASHARASSIPDTDTRSVTIAFKLTSVTAGVFLCTDSTTTTMNALVGTTLTISNVPLNVALKASLECFVDGVKVYTAESDSSFTLVDETPYTLNLTLREVKPARPELEEVIPININTRYYVDGKFGDEDKYGVVSDLTNAINGLPIFSSAQSMVFDEEGYFWVNEYDNYTAVITPADEWICLHYYDYCATAFYEIEAFAYDYVTHNFTFLYIDKTIYYDNGDATPAFRMSTVSRSDLLDCIVPGDDAEATQTGPCFEALLKSHEVIPTDAEWLIMQSRIAVYNGKLYAIYQHTNEEGSYDCKYLAKFSLETGEILTQKKAPEMLFTFDYEQVSANYFMKLFEGHIDEYGEPIEGDEFWETFPYIDLFQDRDSYYTDLTVMDDGHGNLNIYALYNEDFILIPDDEIAPGETDNYFLNRGAIIKFNIDTLEKEEILGLKEDTQNTIKAKLSAYLEAEGAEGGQEDGMAFAYTDERHSSPIYADIPITWNVPQLNERYFSSPARIIAIKNKKLVIADNGIVYWKEDETDTKHYNGTQDGPEDDEDILNWESEVHIFDTKTRFFTVDLEDFSITDMTTVEATDSAALFPGYSNNKSVFFTQEGGSIWAREASFFSGCVFACLKLSEDTYSQYTNQSLYAFIQFGKGN